MPNFCSNCGKSISDNMKFCPECGMKTFGSLDEIQPSVSQPPPVQQPLSPSDYIPPVTEKKENVPDQTITTKKRSTGEWVAIGCGGIILLIILSAVITGITNNLSSISKDEFINQDISSMSLTINDFPTGWKTMGDPKIGQGTYSSQFMKIEGFSGIFVYNDIYRYQTVESAKAGYQSKKAEITNVKVEPVSLGNEGFGYVDGPLSTVVFRKGNILVITQYGEGGIGAPFSSLSINDARDYAKIIAGKIHS
jgi:hypothetical protein